MYKWLWQRISLCISWSIVLQEYPLSSNICCAKLEFFLYWSWLHLCAPCIGRGDGNIALRKQRTQILYIREVSHQWPNQNGQYKWTIHSQIQVTHLSFTPASLHNHRIPVYTRIPYQSSSEKTATTLTPSPPRGMRKHCTILNLKYASRYTSLSI
jgi:hypothetical protein